MKRVIISTDCIADIPEDIVQKLQISMMYYYIRVDQYRFQDLSEMDTEVLIEYIDTHEDYPETGCASAEEYRDYFHKLCREAAAVIHLSMARYMSKGYDTACEASADMEQVYVVDTGVTSSSLAILAMYAADLSRRGCPAAVILEALERKKKLQLSTFLVNKTSYMVRGKKMGARIARILDALRLRPVFIAKNSRLNVIGVVFGGDRAAARVYINRLLRNKDAIDTSILFITTAGCTEEFQKWLCQEAKKRVKWDRIILQPASATTSCNWGSESFGLLFARKQETAYGR